MRQGLSHYCKKLKGIKMNYDLPLPQENISGAMIDEIIDEAAFEEFKELAETLQLSEEQAQGIWDWIVEGALRFVGDLNVSAREYCDETENQLRSLYGNDFEAKQKAAHNLIMKYGGEEMAAFLKKSGIGNCREIVSFLIKLADAAGEDRGLIGEKSSVLSSEEKIKAEIARLMAVPAYMQARHPEHEATVQQVYRLRKRLFGEE